MIFDEIQDLSRLELRSWDQHLGNKRAKRDLRNLVYAVRVLGRRAGFRLMFRGPSRSGKTSLIQYAVKCIGCFNLNFKTLGACHACPNCKISHHLHGNVGWESYVDFCRPNEAPTPMYYRYVYIDCTRITAAELEEIFLQIDRETTVVQIVYFDEIHRLVRRQLDQLLLIPTDRQDVIYLGSAVRLNELEAMLVNRFRIINMQKPTPKALYEFLIGVCAEFGVTCEAPKATLALVAERSNQITGTALQVINAAYQSPEKLLTREMVEEYVSRLGE